MAARKPRRKRTATARKPAAAKQKNAQETCSTCFAGSEFPNSTIVHAGKLRCRYWPKLEIVEKNHWCAQWESSAPDKEDAAETIDETHTGHDNAIGYAPTPGGVNEATPQAHFPPYTELG